MKEAKRIGCSLYSHDKLTGNLSKNTDSLQSLKCQKAPFEYSDSSGGVMANGAFTFSGGFLVSERT